MITFTYQKIRSHPKVKDEKGLLSLAVFADVLLLAIAIDYFTPFGYIGA